MFHVSTCLLLLKNTRPEHVNIFQKIKLWFTISPKIYHDRSLIPTVKLYILVHKINLKEKKKNIKILPVLYTLSKVPMYPEVVTGLRDYQFKT